MKKNRAMRIAALLLVLTMMTSCFVGGTFAKYVTEGTTNEQTARVAKWGVNFAMTGGPLFTTSYDTDDTGYEAVMATSVKADSEVVAPGTEGTAITFSVTGTPEVSYEVSFDILDSAETIWLKDGVTTYYPIKWTYTIGDEAAVTTTDFAAVITAIETYSFYFNVEDGKYYDASHVELTNTSIVINWEWDFEGADTNNTYDTDLGNAAAGIALEGGKTANTDIVIELTAIAEQID